MRIINQIIKFAPVVLMLVLADSCEKDYFYEAPLPNATPTLEASFVTTAPSSVNSAYWKSADYRIINSENVSTNNLYGDGLLNMTASYSGISSFNNGTNPGLRLKAAYDNDNLYILAEWTDLEVDLSEGSWLWNGPTDILKTDSTTGWTSQRNCDHVAFAFEISNASSSAGTFSNVGCKAACHSNAGNSYMYPNSGVVDIWNWNLARTAPLGYAEDMVANSDSLTDDSGNKMYSRNVNGSTSRSGPAYEWDGLNEQNIILSTGSPSILDPAFYIYSNTKTPFTGDIKRGDSLYHTPAPPGDCVYCHGSQGQGGSNTAINTISNNRKSRNELISNMDNIGDMFSYWAPLSPSDKNDIVAYMRGLSGVPGYYLSTPDGSNADVKALSNLTPVQIKNAMLTSTNKHTIYQVLFMRKLKTNNIDDIQFDISSQSSYIFGVALMNNDGKNHIGSPMETLTFK